MLSRRLISCVLMVLTLSLVACAKDRLSLRKRVDRQHVMVKTYGIPQRQGVTDKRTYTLLTALNTTGISVITIGQDYRVIVPVERLFFSSSPRIMWPSYETLNLVVEYLQQFRKISVRVSAYSKGKDRERAGALSLARARAVSDYLWKQDVDARLIYTQAHSLNSDACCQEGMMNRGDEHSHVEITFRDEIA